MYINFDNIKNIEIVSIEDYAFLLQKKNAKKGTIQLHILFQDPQWSECFDQRLKCSLNR